MTAKILDGLKIAESVHEEIKYELLSYQRPPTLAVVLCGNDPASLIYVREKNTRRENGVYCEQCLLSNKEKRVEKILQRKNSQKCIACGKEDVIGDTQCVKCKNVSKIKDSKIRASRKEKGLCIKCGKNEVCDSHVKCDVCLTKQSLSQYEKANIFNKQGLCICGSVQLEDNKFCQTCYLKKVSTKRTGSSNNWNLLLDKFNLQNARCPYSGVDLVLGKNADLDHRVAITKGGTNQIENLQWVYRPINTMKWNWSEEEFLEFVKKVYEFKIMKTQ